MNNQYIFIIDIVGTDCVNGTLVGHRLLTSQSWDWTNMRNLLVKETSKSVMNRQEVMAAPHTSKLVIFDRTKVRTITLVDLCP